MGQNNINMRNGANDVWLDSFVHSFHHFNACKSSFSSFINRNWHSGDRKPGGTNLACEYASPTGDDEDSYREH